MKHKYLTSVFLALGVVLILLPLLVRVKALNYEATMRFDVVVNETLDADVSQNVTVTNKAKDFLASSVTMNMPFDSVENLDVSSNGKQLPARVEEGRLWIEFRDKPLDTGESRELDIRYTIPKLAEDHDEVKRVIWPKFRVEKENVSYELRIILPKEWNPLIYSNLKPKINEFENTGVLSYSKVNREVEVITGKYNMKNARVGINQQSLKDRIGELNFHLREGMNFLASNRAVNITQELNGTEARLNLEPYFENKGITLLSKPELDFPAEANMNGYFEGTEKFTGTDTLDVEKLYKIMLSRYEPETNIGTWERLNVEEIIEKDRQSDLDYANSLVALYRSKSIPAHIVYGMVEYPDGRYYWHFWVVYQKAVENKVSWYEADPYLEDLTGKDYFKAIPPMRVLWDILPANSDLSDLSRDLFLLEVEDISFKDLENATAESGYITSQLNKRQISLDESVLGLSDFNNQVLVEIVLKATVMTMGIFLVSVIYLIHRKFKN